MSPNVYEPLHRSIAILGGVSATAQKLGVTSQVVWNWQKRGIPAKYVLNLVDAVNHQVSAKELRPDVFIGTAGPIAGKFDGNPPPNCPPGT